MVAIISGLRGGLNLNSGAVLGLRETVGGTLQGRNGQNVAVNIALGQVVVQGQDDLLVSRGLDAGVIRTYNSNGSFNDDNGDGWTNGITLLRLFGTVNAAGSSIQRVEPDGGGAGYNYDATRNLYVTSDGAGAFDTITYIAADNQFEWRDGATGATQRYEASGAYRLLSSRDAAGNVQTYSYGANGFLSAVTTASGDVVYYDYTGNNLTQVRTVSGGVTTTRVRYEYDTSNRLKTVKVDLTPSDNSISDGNVYQTTYTYDGTSSRIASITQSDGTSVAFTYVDTGGGVYKVATVKDGLNQTTTFTYGNRFTTVTDPLGLVTRYDYNGSSQLTTITAPAVGGTSATRQFTYDAWDNVLSATDGEGRTVTYQYDGNGNQVLQRDAAGNTVTRTYDARNQLLTETAYLQPDPDGAGTGQPGTPMTTRYVYDAGGHNLLRFTVSADGRVTEYRYDGFGQQVAAITYAAGSYPVSGLAATTALAESDLTTWAGTQDLTTTQRVDFGYDGRGQLQTRTGYARVDASGTGVADGSQTVLHYVYDQAGLLLQTVDGRNGTTNYTYDGMGRVLTATDAKNQVTVTQYNDAGRKTVVTLATGLITTSSYDAAGRLFSIAQTNAAAAQLGETKYFYDADGRLRMTQDPTGVRSWMLYDEMGRKTADIDGNGTLTAYGYDKSNRVIWQPTWGTAVNTSGLVDAQGLPVLSVTLSSLIPPDSASDVTVWRQYDTAGRLLREATGTGTGTGTGATATVTEYRYDGASQLVQTVQYANTIPLANIGTGTITPPATSSQDRITRNFYDNDGHLAGMLDGEGYLTVYNRDAAGRLVETIAYATATPSAQRATGTLAQLLPAAAAADIRSVNLYDGKGQLVGAVDGEGYLTENVYDASGNVTQSVRYATRVAGTVSTSASLGAIRPAANAADRCTTRIYDALNRVTEEASPEGIVTQYSYDFGGNLVSTVRAANSSEARTLLARYDLQGRLTGALSAEGAALLTGGQTQAQVDAIWAQYGTSYTYDAAGRRTSMTDAAGNKTLFFYNADGALTHTVNALGEVSESRYDARGRVVEQYTYVGRISTSGLTGGLVPAGLTSALAAIAGSLDIVARYTYTRDGEVATAWDAASATTTTHTYDAFGEEITTTRGLDGGRTLTQTATYDHRGLRIGTVADPNNTYGVKATTTTDYDAFGRATRSVDANGNVRLQSYDRLGRVVTTQDPLNALRTSSYDAFGRVLTQTDPLGKVTTFAYDTTARSMTVTTPEGIQTTTTYTRNGQVQSIADGKGQVTSYTYDRDGNLRQTTTPLTTSSSTYDGADRLIQTTDAAGNQVLYTYDAANRVFTRRVDPNGLNLTTTYGYNGKGQQVSVTDPNGVVTTRQFDNKGQVLRETVDPTGLNLQTVYTYDPRGNVLTVTTPGGSVTQYGYDVLGRRTQERVDPTGLNLTRTWTYDGNGNALTSTDARGNVTRYVYDANDRLVFTVDPLGNVRQNGYDAAGRVVKSVSYAAPVSLTGLPAKPTLADIQSRLTSQPALDAVENRVYDKDGRLTYTVDGTGAVTRFTYDANGNVVARTAYATSIDLAAWTPGTQPAVVADAAHDATVQTLYDALNRAIYTFDGTGAVVTQSYDGNGNVLQRTAYATAIPNNTPFTQAALSAAVAAVANPARDASVRNTYDAAGRLTWTADGTGAVTQRVYDKNGNVVRQVAYATAVAASAAPSSVANSANDRSTAMAYDAANRMVFQVDATRAVTELVLDADGHVVRQTRYANAIASVPALGTSGTVAAIRAALTADATVDRSTRYGYDAAGRQVLAVDATGAVTETQYDAAGNAIATIAYAAQVTSGLPATPTLASLRALVVANASADRVTQSAYDAAGQQVYRIDPTGAVVATQYDGIGHVTRTTRYSATIPAGTANTAAAIASAMAPLADATKDQTDAFTYNAAGQLIATTDAMGSTESYTYDALGRKLRFVNKLHFAWTYTYDAAGRMLTETTPQVALTTVSANGAGNLVAGATSNAAVVTQLAYDALGNLTQRTEAVGRPEERTTRYEYDAVGRQVRVVFPPVGVYNAAGDNIATNGVAGLASRVETTKTLDTRTYYDTLGNAVANKDVGDATSQKVYDLLGRVVYEVDALGYVTGYTRNAFGDVTSLVRYGAGTTLANGTVTQAAQAVTKAQVDAVVNGTGFDHSQDRLLRNTYDLAGRVLDTSEPSAYVYAYDPAATGGQQTGTTGRKTRNTYDAFGQLVQVKVLRYAASDTPSAGDVWATTTHYFDKDGRETGTIDALGYLTERRFDNAGNVTSEIQYANAAPSGWTVSGYTKPASSTSDDRTTTYTYDLLNRKTSENRANVEYSELSNGSSTRGWVTTSYGYDAVGNQTLVTDAGGGKTFTYYDALGRITAVAAPSRNSTVSGAALTPLTEFRRDEYGNVVAKIDYANSAAAATIDGYTAGIADAANDHVTLAAYDSFGHAVQGTNANGASDFTSYDAYGHAVKHWQAVTGNDGTTRTAFELDAYDKIGHLILTQASASAVSAVDQGGAAVTQAPVITTAMEYNAFGEMTRKGVNGGRQEYFDYDNAGRLWRTNTGDGADRVYLYDAQGNQTAEIRSSGSGGVDTDIKGFVNAQAAAANPYTRRVDIQYDLLGRVTARTEAARQDLQGGVAVTRQFTTATVAVNASSQVGEGGYPAPGAINQVNLGWNSLASLGSGDIKVTIEYLTMGVPNYGEGSQVIGYGPPSLRSYSSGIFNGDAAAGGAALQWAENPATNDIGVSSVTRIVVYKKDVYGNWQVVIDQAPGYGANEITVATPPAANTGLTLQMRAAGSAGDTGWWTAGLVNFGNAMRFDARGLAVGNYEYRVTVSPANEASRVTGTGTAAITQPPLNSIDANIRYGQPNVQAGIMTWNDPGAGYTQVFRFRPAGSTGGWSTLPVISQAATWGSAAYVGVDTRVLGAGSYQYELLWTVNGQGVPSAHATGSFVVVAAVPPQWVPPVNLPNITGVAISSPYLQWNAAGATVARYRVAGGGWNYLTINNDGVTSGESGESGGMTGVQKVSLSGIPPGTYLFEIYAGSPAVAQATATVTIYPQNPPWSETVYDQVPVYTPVIAYYQPVYETRWAQQWVPHDVWVFHQTGTDESGNPIGYYEKTTQWSYDWYSYQVQVGSTPVYATDEAGNIIYNVTYTQQPRTVWHDGAIPTPTAQVTTPPYTPGYTIPGVPTQYGVNVTTPGGSAALSTTDGAVISQAAGVNGDNRMLRPTVYQKFDRWGNVLEVSDPRSPYWKTTYKYNANNQVVLQTQPDSNGAQSGSSPVTAIFYDRMGRQVAIRDANAHVNGQVYDAAGNLVKELHADGGTVTYAYDAFGNKVRTTDAENKVVWYGYDRMGHMLRMVGGAAGVYTVNGGNALQYVDTRNITQTWSYDQLGNKLSQTNGNGETTRYTYDLRGNVIATTQPLGQVLRDVYDAQGRKIQETDANGSTSTWSYDYFGLLLGHTDLGGASYSYAYDHARQLTYQSSGHGQSISYTYDAAGQVTMIQDWALGKTTTYAYDLSGRKLRERVVQGGITYQDNHMAYDARGNLRDVADARAHVVMEYDLAGNRTRVANFVDYQGVGGAEAAAGSDRYFQYDAMNRQVIVDAVNAAGDLGQQGHAITYDHNGNRTSDTYWGPQVAVVGGQQIIWTYNEDGSANYITTPIDYVQTNGYTREDYRYDALNRLQSVVKDGTQIDVRYYDGADRVVQSGPAGALPTKYADIINAGLTPEQMNGKETRVNRYDANGRLMHQTVLKSDNSLKLNISYDPNENNQGFVAAGYDAVGNALGYTVTNHEAGVINKYDTSLVKYEGYQASVTQGVSTKQLPGSTTQGYDANGFLVSITDSTQGANNRTFVNDSAGRALYVNQAGNVQRQMIVNGEVLGLYGAGVNSSNPASGYENNPNFANVVDFDFGYAKVSANYPSPSPGAYTVRVGDTLQTIAQGAYGDSSLWYRIAEANGLGSNADLKVGQTLNIPNRVSTISNNSTTFKPYDPSQIEGDKTPSLATPKPKKKSGLGMLLMVIVAIIVTIYTAGAMSGFVGGFLETMSAGAGVLAGTTTAVAGSIGATLGAAGTAAVAAAAGSIASQLVGMATGNVDKFDWKSVALSALSAGVSAGLPTNMLSSMNQYASVMVRAAVGNAITQGIGVTLGLQQRFDWKGVAASAAAAGVGQAVGEGLGLSQIGRPATMGAGEFIAKSFVKGMAAGLTAAAAKGGKVVVQQVAVDAFGNALANSLAETQSSMYSLATGDSGLGLRPGAGGQGLTFGGNRAAELPTDDAARVYGALAAAMYAERDASQDRAYEPGEQYASGPLTDRAGNRVVTDAGGGGGGRIADNMEANRAAAQEKFRALEYKSPVAAADNDPGINWANAFGLGAPEGPVQSAPLTRDDAVDAPKGVANSFIKQFDALMRVIATSQLNSPEMVIGAAQSPNVAQARDKALAAVPEIGIGEFKYDGQSAVGPIVEAGTDVGQVVWGGYGLLKGGVKLAGVGFGKLGEFLRAGESQAGAELKGIANATSSSVEETSPLLSASRQPVEETSPLLPVSRQPGTVTRNALTDAEFAQAQDLATFRGGKFVGAPKDSYAGIDGWLDGVPTQLKIVTGNGERAILRNIVKGAENMSKQGYVGDIAIDATQTGVSIDRFAKFVAPNTPVGRILNEPSINNVYLKLSDGWLNITRGTITVPGRMSVK